MAGFQTYRVPQNIQSDGFRKTFSAIQPRWTAIVINSGKTHTALKDFSSCTDITTTKEIKRILINFELFILKKS